MRFFLAGAPGTGKGDLVEALVKVRSFTINDGLHVDPELAVGRGADYRVELKLAVDRSLALHESRGQNTLFEHSLLDSVAYAALHYILVTDTNSVSQYTQDKWACTAAVITAMLRDTFEYDHVFYLPSTDPEWEDVDFTLRQVMESYSVAYTELSGSFEENLATASAVVEAYDSKAEDRQGD